MTWSTRYKLGLGKVRSPQETNDLALSKISPNSWQIEQSLYRQGKGGEGLRKLQERTHERSLHRMKEWDSILFPLVSHCDWKCSWIDPRRKNSTLIQKTRNFQNVALNDNFIYFYLLLLRSIIILTSFINLPCRQATICCWQQQSEPKSYISII